MYRHPLFPLVLVAWMISVLTLIRLSLLLFGLQPVLNLTVSAPRGLYLVQPIDTSSISRGMLVRLNVPPRFAAYVYGRHWLPDGTPLLKTVAGMPGDVFCVEAGRFSINGRDMGPVFKTDSQGLALPVIYGCSTVPHHHFVAVSTFHPKSFDGRYMGEMSMDLVTGQGRLLWTF